MNDIKALIEKRNLPSVLEMKPGEFAKTPKEFSLRREEIKKLLSEGEYGIIPPRPEHLTVRAVELNESFCRGNAPLSILEFTVTVGGKDFKFPVKAVIPKSNGKLPAFVHISFFEDLPNKYEPCEEISDDGFAIFSFCYKNITSDDGDFKNGIAPYFTPQRRNMNAPGKIAMWAWAAMRVMDYIEGLEEIDSENVAVVGHSRLGKTALLAGAFDERFKYVISNDSGCSGAALSRGKTGETNAIITNVFPYWFCPRYVKQAADFCENSKFDQHFLLSLIAPRYLLVGSAEEDLWADPVSEFLCCCAASDAYQIYGLRGLIHNNEIPDAKEVLADGEISYHVRHGAHYFSREDWRVYMDFIKKKMK